MAQTKLKDERKVQRICTHPTQMYVNTDFVENQYVLEFGLINLTGKSRVDCGVDHLCVCLLYTSRCV